MKIICIIPARMESSRFPGKPMFKIDGVPMIEKVFLNVKKNKLLDKVIVATCNKVIFDHINQIGGMAVMTSKVHKRASDRCFEALKKIEKKNKEKYDIVVMVQGDEPMVHPNMINQAIKPMLNDKKIQVVNLMSKIRSREEFNNPNTIKITYDKNFNAIYFSRSKIPFTNLKKNLMNKFKQVCIIPFRRKFLFLYSKLKPTNLEKLESIDMLRIIENGYKVKLVNTNYITHAVDTVSDVKKVIKLSNK